MSNRDRMGLGRPIVGLLSCTICLGFSAQSLGEIVWGKNLIANPSFEVGKEIPTRWEKRIGAQSQHEGEEVLSLLSMDTSIAHSGKQSLQLSGDARTSTWHTVESYLVPVKPGLSYKFSGWIKTEKVVHEGRQYRNSNMYIQFGDSERKVIMFGRSQVLATHRLIGTNDWRLVERVVTAPPGSAFARIGCVLSCSGSAWFDDVGLYPQVNVEWQKVETDRIVFLHEPGDEFDKDAADDLLKYLTEIEGMLDLKHEGKIHYYKYRSPERKDELTGNPGDAHEFGNEIHAVRWDDKHEIIFVVTRPMGASILLLRNGVAAYLTEKRLIGNLHGYVTKMSGQGMLPSLRTLADNKEFKAEDQEKVLAMAGSFVRYLIEEYGLVKFKQLYTKADAHEPVEKFGELFHNIYGRDLIDIEALWRTLITAGVDAVQMP